MSYQVMYGQVIGLIPAEEGGFCSMSVHCSSSNHRRTAKRISFAPVNEGKRICRGEQICTVSGDALYMHFPHTNDAEVTTGDVSDPWNRSRLSSCVTPRDVAAAPPGWKECLRQSVA